MQFRCVEVSETDLDPFFWSFGSPDAQAVAIAHISYGAGEGRPELFRERAFTGIGRGWDSETKQRKNRGGKD